MELLILTEKIKQAAYKPVATYLVPFLLRDGTHVRQGVVTLPASDNYAADLAERLNALWAAAQPVPDGLRAWYAFRQRRSDEWFNRVIFAVFVQVQQGADLPTMLAAANLVLDEDELQKAIYEKLNTALQSATETQFRQFVALALTVVYGKVGQR
jgi:predicted metalloendopeptidase